VKTVDGFISNCEFCIYGSCTILGVNSDHYLNSNSEV
jgi:hypothetical protein